MRRYGRVLTHSNQTVGDGRAASIVFFLVCELSICFSHGCIDWLIYSFSAAAHPRTTDRVTVGGLFFLLGLPPVPSPM